MAPARIKHTEHHDNNNHKVNVPSLRRALVNRNFAKLWYGQAVSAIGDTVFGTTLVLWVSQVLVRGSAWAPAAVSGILVAAAAAVGLVGPVAGVFVDRWNRKSTMMRTEAVRAAMVAGLTGLSFVPVRDLPIGLWLVVVQTRHADWARSPVHRRRAYAVSLHFAIPGLMSLLSLVDPSDKTLWRIAFGVSATGGAITLAYLGLPSVPI